MVLSTFSVWMPAELLKKIDLKRNVTRNQLIQELFEAYLRNPTILSQQFNKQEKELEIPSYRELRLQILGKRPWQQ